MTEERGVLPPPATRGRESFCFRPIGRQMRIQSRRRLKPKCFLLCCSRLNIFQSGGGWNQRLLLASPLAARRSPLRLHPAAVSHYRTRYYREPLPDLLTLTSLALILLLLFCVHKLRTAIAPNLCRENQTSGLQTFISSVLQVLPQTGLLFVTGIFFCPLFL